MKNTILPFIVCSILIGCCTFANAQEPATTLSKNGSAHWRAAQVLSDMASSTDDYEQVIIEFEKVIESDPGYAPVYMKLGHLYAQLGNTKGEDAFDKARSYFRMCKNICEDSADVADAEIVIVDALSRKYANGPNRFVGTWGTWWDGEFSPDVEITYDGNGYVLHIVNEYYTRRNNFMVETCSPTEIVFTFQRVDDKRDELRMKGWTKYYDDCNSQADPGYSQSGRYYYNITKHKHRLSYAIEGNKVVRKYLMIHTDYFLDGQKTYAETEYNWSPATELVKYK